MAAEMINLDYKWASIPKLMIYESSVEGSAVLPRLIEGTVCLFEDLPFLFAPDGLSAMKLLQIMLCRLPGEDSATHFFQIDQRNFRRGILPTDHDVLVVEAAMLQSVFMNQAEHTADFPGKGLALSGIEIGLVS